MTYYNNFYTRNVVKSIQAGQGVTITGDPSRPIISASSSSSGPISFTDIEGTASATQIPNLPASKITAGFLAIGRIPTGTSGTTVALGNHTHTDLTDSIATKLTSPTGTASATTFACGDGTWKTPTNTTYTVISEAEFTTGTATTARAVSAVSLNRDVQAKIISYLLSLPNAAPGSTLTINAAGTGFEWVGP